MSSKSGRNEPCWCGSGHKYKRCHGNSSPKSPSALWDVAKRSKKLFSAKYCLAPQSWLPSCSGKIITAHTIPKSSSLDAISRDGHVYALKPGLDTLVRTGGTYDLELVGINKASTFTGFCSKHDDQIFAPLEKMPFCASREQLFLLSYRAFCRELFMKKAQLLALPELRTMDIDKAAEQQVRIQSMISGYITGAKKAISELERKKRKYDSAITERAFLGYESFVIKLSTPPPVMCSGCIFPEYGFDGDKLQDLTDKSKFAQLISVSSFSDGSCGWISFTWHIEDRSVSKALVNELNKLSDSEITDTLLSFMFEYFENICIDPKWWESLADGQRQTLISRVNSMNQPWAPRSRNSLTNPNLGIIPWQITQRNYLDTLPW